MRFRFDKIDGFIRIYDGTRYLTLFGFKKYDPIYDKIRYLITLKSGITYIFSHYLAKIEVVSYVSLPIEKKLTLHNVIILIKDIRPLVLIMPKMNGYVKKFKVEDKINKLMSFHMDDEKLLQKYKAIWTKLEDLKNIKLNALPVYDARYIKTKIKIYINKVYTNFRGLNMP